MAACWILEGCSCVATKMNLFQAFQIAQVIIVQASNSLCEDAEVSSNVRARKSHPRC
jgi:hypothetical protein